MWGEQQAKAVQAGNERGHLFEWGNYAMFIHWGLFSHLGNVWDGKTYYGIGEWMIDVNMANRRNMRRCWLMWFTAISLVHLFPAGLVII